MKPRNLISTIVIILAILLAVVAVTLIGCGCGETGGGGASEGASPGSAGSSAGETTTASTPGTSSPTTILTTTLAPTTTESTPEETILEGMTLREKAAQVLLVAFEGTTLLPATEAMLTEDPPGGLLLLSRNVTGSEQLTSLTAALQDAAAAAGAKTRLFIAVDQEGGSVQRIRTGVPYVPAARDLGEDVALAEAGRLAEETASSLLELGVNMNLAPVADVVSDPGSFLYRRTYGGDPTLVADFVETVVGAYLRSGLISVVKHFPGHGSASGDTHGEIVVSEASQTEFATTHLLPFKAAFATGVECVMVAHIVVPAYDPDRPASLSGAVVDGLLREGLGFLGVVIADDLEMAAAAGAQAGSGAAGGATDIGNIAVAALEAGCDLLISTGTIERQVAMRDAIVEAVESGRLSRERLDEAVLRLLELKSRHDLTAP